MTQKPSSSAAGPTGNGRAHLAPTADTQAGTPHEAAGEHTRARQQAVVADLGIRALAGLTPPVLLQETAELVANTLGTELVKILELLPDGETARVVAGVGWHDDVVGKATVRVGHDSQAGYALLTHAPVIVEDLGHEPRLGDPPLLREHGVVSGVSVILYGPGKATYGVIGAHTTRPRHFTQDDVNFLQGIANVLSAALYRQHMEDELRRAHAVLQDQTVELESQMEEAQALAEELEQTNEQLMETAADAERSTQAAERARDASAFLAEVSRLLGGSLNYDTTLQTVAEAAVPRLGDWCAVDLVRNPSSPEWPPHLDRVALVHQDPEKRVMGETLHARYPVDWSETAGMAAVIRDGTSLFVPEITDEMLARSAKDDEHLALTRALQFSSVIIVPLETRGLRLGALTLCHTESGRRYDEADLALAEELARRAAVAVDNARLYHAAEAARAAAEDARRAAEEANRAKSQFLAMMSHELRTPLNAVAGYVQLLELGVHGPVTEAQLEALGRIDRAGKHLLGLINDVLNFARLESGRVEYDVEPVLVADVVRDVWPLVEPQFRAKGIAFESRLPEGAGRPPIPVCADRERLTQVLLNLLSNAVKFTPAVREGRDGPVEGRVTVELSEPAGDVSTSDDEKNDRVYLRVIDTGIGIPANRVESVFEPFVQVKSELTRDAGGTGLGLAISRDLARGMGGDLYAESVEGAGSVFTIALKRADGLVRNPK